ncbi:CHASE2 domain-containing protein [Rheinheimera tilapiae]|uniref:CHASE2 domain-containing protein n=1 Tax=Rheinheimera tilapiae TaxID=875043 RepID=A0ABV6BG66_9GAMM
MTRLQLTRWLVRQSIPLFIFAGVLLLQWSAPSGLARSLQRLEGLLYDAKVQYLPPWPRSVSNIQIVDLDEASLHEIGRMPWDRQHFVKLSDALAKAGAVLVVYDVLFSEPQANAALLALQSWTRQTTLPDAQRQDLLEHASQLDPDARFANTLRTTEVVLANLLHRHGNLRTGQLSPAMFSVAQQRPVGATAFEPFSGFAAPIAPLAAAVRGQGFINAEEDADGFVRRVALLHQLDQQLYPSLALEAFRVYSLLDQVQPRWLQHNGGAYLQGVQIGSSLVRTDQQGRILIPYRGGARHYPYTSAADVLAGRIKDQRFDQAVVFVGTSATGLADLQATPTALNFPGVEIHATVFDGLMAPQTLPYRPDWWAGATLLQLLLAGLLCLWLFPKLGPLGSAATTLSLLLLSISLNLWLWRTQMLDLPLLSPLLLVSLLSVYFISYGFVSETRRRKQINAVFDQYLPPAHIQRLLADPASVSLAGEKKQLTVLFCDIRGFTTISEQMSAQQLKLWLNQYFNALTRAIQQHDGTIDKYVGDMVMAFWGAPLAEQAHARKALTAAFAMLKALEALNRSFQAAGQPVARIGIGINSGEMNVGDMGSDFRRSYTVIGDAVNLGSRLEGLTKFYGVPLLVSEFTKAEAPEFDYLLVDKVRVKGKRIPIRIYLPLEPDLAPAQRSQCQLLQQALDAYFHRDFSAAQLLLQDLHPQICRPQDSYPSLDLAPLINLYLQRISVFNHEPPPPDWDGSHLHS